MNADAVGGLITACINCLRIPESVIDNIIRTSIYVFGTALFASFFIMFLGSLGSPESFRAGWVLFLTSLLTLFILKLVEDLRKDGSRIRQLRAHVTRRLARRRRRISQPQPVNQELPRDNPTPGDSEETGHPHPTTSEVSRFPSRKESPITEYVRGKLNIATPPGHTRTPHRYAVPGSEAAARQMQQSLGELDTPPIPGAFPLGSRHSTEEDRRLQLDLQDAMLEANETPPIPGAVGGLRSRYPTGEGEDLD